MDIPLPWSITTTPSSVFDLVSGNVEESVTGESILLSVSDPLGDSLSGEIVPFGNPASFFSYTPDGTGGDLFTGTVQIQSATEGLLLGGLGLTSTELESTPLQLTLDINCGAENPCIATADPTGTITDVTLGPSIPSAVPEPRFAYLLAGALVWLPLLRRRPKRA